MNPLSPAEKAANFGTRVQCMHCGDVLQSRWSGEFVMCMCGCRFIDSTEHYSRFGFTPWEEGDELSPLDMLDASD